MLMAMESVRRIAAEILGVGESKVRFKQESLGKIADALTREDVRTLIREGDIYAISPRGVSRVRAKEKAKQKRKGRRSGKGSRKGPFGARIGKKSFWMKKVRAQRKFLSSLIGSGRIEKKAARKIYLMIKGNAFRGVKALEAYLEDNKLLAKAKKEEGIAKK